jgi:thioester reductase-like protein
MGNSAGILLTGATGFLGRFLLRELLLSGRPVTVLARGHRALGARERIAEQVCFWAETLGTQMPIPDVIVGDLTAPGVGMSSVDRSWLSRSCRTVVHAAACIGLRATLDGEPWKTNVQGTRQLLRLCLDLGLQDVHYISTAFVCGRRPGPIREDELDQGAGFHNEYERSKCAAETELRQTSGIRLTVYRPSVIVGDSRTGYTSSYHGLYRFLDLGNRLAEPAPSGRRALPLRVPFSGEEPRNLVPVDWVAEAIRRIVLQPKLHGRSYHLTAARPVLARLIKEVAEEVLGIDGVVWAGSEGLIDPTPLEDIFIEHLEEYWPYRDGDPVFDQRNTRAALPDLPAPEIDRPLLERLIRFAVADHWGRRQREDTHPAVSRCAQYLEHFFPAAARGSSLARLALDVTVGLEVFGPMGGQWTCRLTPETVSVCRGREALADVVYRLDAATLGALVTGSLTLPDAFLARRVEIEGDVERGLKLGVLFDRFVRECPFRPSPEAPDACVVSA